MAKEKISVIMGVFNCCDTIKEAISTIQNQTYDNWELIICDDGSNDETYKTIEEIAESEPRIVLLRNEENKGLNFTLNRCLSVATGEYIARMDGDDKCLPERFEKQINFLNSQNEFDIVATAMSFFDENGIWGRNDLIEKPNVKDIVVQTSICHATVMLRKKCMDEVGGYTIGKRFLRVEDADLWIKLYEKGYRCYNFDEPLYQMRNDKNAFSRRKFKYRINEAYVRLRGCRIFHLGVKCYFLAILPIFKGLVPAFLRRKIRKNT